MNSQNTTLEFKKKIEQIKQLPTLPEIGKQLLDLQQNPDATIQDLGKIIEFDPILTSQLLRHSNSAFFSTAKTITSIQDAIMLIGFDSTLNLAMGLISAKSFQIPIQGPIGMRAFWLHAIYSANLMQLLATKVPTDTNIKTGMAYLAGLLHNFGLVLLGHEFTYDFKLINDALEDDPKTDLLTVEKSLLGFHHFQVGSWLMRKWGLPPEIMTTVLEHHNEHYQGDFREYANLALVADRALFAYSIGDSDSEEIPSQILNTFHLTSEEITEYCEQLMEKSELINAMVDSIIESSH